MIICKILKLKCMIHGHAKKLGGRKASFVIFHSFQQGQQDSFLRCGTFLNANKCGLSALPMKNCNRIIRACPKRSF